ncbi:hypothetical protein DXZ75_05305 [Streptomyces sp. AcE210]|nr:hypothetical protein DXZ75_05305 [Streptomyces sp. AcE210]
MTGMVGSVTRQRYDELVKLGRGRGETLSSVQWQLGDAAMEIEPMRCYGGTTPSGSGELLTCSPAGTCGGRGGMRKSFRLSPTAEAIVARKGGDPCCRRWRHVWPQSLGPLIELASSMQGTALRSFRCPPKRMKPKVHLGSLEQPRSPRLQCLAAILTDGLPFPATDRRPH